MSDWYSSVIGFDMNSSAPDLLILDRDGVLLKHVASYIRSWDDVTELDGAFATLAGFQSLGVPVAVVTNQSVIGRGLAALSFVEAVHDWISSGVERVGGTRRIAYYVCRHTPDDRCGCRKPAPGLLRAAQHDFSVPPARSWMVGDHDTDIEAGVAALCGASMHVRSERQAARPPKASRQFSSLAAVYEYVRTTDGLRTHR